MNRRAKALALLALSLIAGLRHGGTAAAPPSADPSAPSPTAQVKGGEVPSAPPGYGEVHVIVLGVTSPFAPFATFGLGRRFLEVPGVTRMRFIMEEGRAILWLAPGAEVSGEALRKAVRNASFTAGRIIWVRQPAPKDASPPSPARSG